MTLLSSVPATEVVALPIWNSILEKSVVDIYADSPFLPLKQLNSRTKGAKFEQILQEHLERLDYVFTKAKNSDWDRTLNGKKLEIKGSFLWDKTNTFKWQQIRVDQEYDYIVFMAFYTDCLEIYIADRETVHKAVTRKDADGNWLHNQHGGKKVKNATVFQLQGMPDDFPWMKRLSPDNLG